MSTAIQTKQDIKLVIDSELSAKIELWKKEKRNYGIFPITGDSMTCKNHKSIPDGSHVLACESNFSFNGYSSETFAPTDTPLILFLESVFGETQVACKTINFIDGMNRRFLLRSYNSDFPDTWIPIDGVKRIFEIIKVIK